MSACGRLIQNAATRSGYIQLDSTTVMLGHFDSRYAWSKPKLKCRDQRR